MTKLMRALIYYVEETQLHNLAAPENASSARNRRPTPRPGNTTRTATTTTRRRSGASTSDGRAATPLQPPHPADADRHRGPGTHTCHATRWSSAPAASVRPPRSTSPRPASARITLADDDTVDLTNLQRQILHTQITRRHGQGRIRPRSAGRDQSRTSRSFPCSNGWPAQRWMRWSPTADVVLDCSDNFATRHAVNRACVQSPQAAGFRRRDPFRRPGHRLRPRAATTAPVLPLPVSRGRGRRGSALRGDGRFRPADRHHRHHAGRRGAETGHRLRRNADRPPAAARRAGNGMAYRSLQEGRRLYGLRP